MIPVAQQVEALQTHLTQLEPPATVQGRALPSGAYLIKIENYALPPGWNRSHATILFIAPPGFPGAQPDCFWVVPLGLRLANGTPPQSSNDANPIPEVPEEQGTWFSWHVETWHPNRDSLITYYNVVRQRLEPAR